MSMRVRQKTVWKIISHWNLWSPKIIAVLHHLTEISCQDVYLEYILGGILWSIPVIDVPVSKHTPSGPSCRICSCSRIKGCALFHITRDIIADIIPLLTSVR